jgi:WD40 repeat protein
MVLILIIGLVAFIAIRASQNASQQRDIAVSRQLVTESEHLSAIDPVTAKLKSLAAWRIHPSDDAWQAMLAAASVPGIAVMTGHTGPVMSVAFSPDDKTLAGVSWDGSVRLWDVGSHRQVGSPVIYYSGFSSVAFSPDGKTLATGSADDDSVQLWDVDSHLLIGSPLTGHTDAIVSVAFSPDGTTLATGSWDKSVRLWDVASRRPLGSPLTGHTDGVISVAFSRDGTTLASGSEDNSVRLWDVASRRLVGSPLTGHTGLVE